MAQIVNRSRFGKYRLQHN